MKCFWVVFVFFSTFSSVISYSQGVDTDLFPDFSVSLYRNPTTLKNISRIQSIDQDTIDRYFEDWANHFGIDVVTQSLLFNFSKVVSVDVLYLNNVSDKGAEVQKIELDHRFCLIPSESANLVPGEYNIFEDSELQVAIRNTLPATTPHRETLFSSILSDGFLAQPQPFGVHGYALTSDENVIKSIFSTPPLFDFIDCTYSLVENDIIRNVHRVVKSYYVNKRNLTATNFRNSPTPLIIAYILSSKLRLPLSKITLFEVKDQTRQVEIAFAIVDGSPILFKLTGAYYAPAYELKEFVVKRQFSQRLDAKFISDFNSQILDSFVKDIAEYFSSIYSSDNVDIVPGIVRDQILLSDIRGLVSSHNYWERIQLIPQQAWVSRDDPRELSVLVYVDGDFLQSKSGNPPEEFPPKETLDLAIVYPIQLISAARNNLEKVLNTRPSQDHFDFISHRSAFLRE